MEKREPVESRSRRALAYWRARLLVDLGVGCAMWISSATMSTIVVALQTHESRNALLRTWQRLVSEPVKSTPESVLLSCIALGSVVYVASCLRAYLTAPRPAALVSTACILLFFFETCLNGLEVTPVERLAVVLPSSINIGLTCVMLHPQNRRSGPVAALNKLEV